MTGIFDSSRGALRTSSYASGVTGISEKRQSTAAAGFAREVALFLPDNLAQNLVVQVKIANIFAGACLKRPLLITARRSDTTARSDRTTMSSSFKVSIKDLSIPLSVCDRDSHASRTVTLMRSLSGRTGASQRRSSTPGDSWLALVAQGARCRAPRSVSKQAARDAAKLPNLTCAPLLFQADCQTTVVTRLWG